MAKRKGWRNRITGHGEEAPDQLLANPNNWRVHPKHQQDALEAVIDRVGFVSEVTVNKRTGYVLDGHLRVAMAISRSEPSVPVTYVDLSEEEEALVLTTLDPIAAMAGADKAQLEALLAGLAGERGGVRALLDDMARDHGIVLGEPLVDPGAQMDRAEELQRKWGTERGQVWAVGEHRVMCGDSTDAADVALLCAGELVEAIWTDPPYGVSYVGKTADALKLKNDGAEEVESLLAEAFAVADSVLAAGGRVYCATPAGPLGIAFRLAFVGAGWQFHESLVWVKDTMVLGHSDYHYRHEDVLYGWKPGSGRVGRGRHEGTRWYGDHAQTSVFEIDRPKVSAKPVSIAEHREKKVSAKKVVTPRKSAATCPECGETRKTTQAMASHMRAHARAATAAVAEQG